VSFGSSPISGVAGAGSASELWGSVNRMAVSQRFIDLLNLPMSALLKLATDLQVELPSGARQWDIAKLVARASRDELEDNDQGFLYAGRTSLSFFRLISDDGNISEDDVEIFRPRPGDALDHDAVVAALQACADCDPFDENDLPADITKEPTLVLARDWQGGLILTFAAAKRVLQVVHNYTAIEVLQDEFFNVFLRLGDGTLEVRASAVKAARLNQGWLSSFADEIGLVALAVILSESDVKRFKKKMNAVLAKGTVNEASGTKGIGTMTLGKSDFCDDLAEDEDYQATTAGYDHVASDLLFECDGVEDPVRVQISTLKGSVFIRNAVPEKVVNDVYDAIFNGS